MNCQNIIVMFNGQLIMMEFTMGDVHFDYAHNKVHIAKCRLQSTCEIICILHTFMEVSTREKMQMRLQIKHKKWHF